MVIAGLDAGGGRIKKPFCTGNGKIWELPAPVLVGSGWCTDASGESAGGERTGYSKADPDSPFCIWTRCHRTKDKRLLFPAELVAQVLGKAVEEVLTEEDLAGLAVSTKGGKKECPAGNGFYIVLNKADDEKRLKMAERIALRVEQDSGEKVRITSFR